MSSGRHHMRVVERYNIVFYLYTLQRRRSSIGDGTYLDSLSGYRGSAAMRTFRFFYRLTLLVVSKSILTFLKIFSYENRNSDE